MTIADPAATRLLLERQLTLIGPVVARLHAASRPSPLSPDHWRGPAAGAYRAADAELRRLLREAAEAAGSAERALRLALRQLDG